MGSESISRQSTMDYLELHSYLKKTVQPDQDQVRLQDGLQVSRLVFRSASADLLPGEDHYRCAHHGDIACEPDVFSNGTGTMAEILDVHDSRVHENREFAYSVFHARPDAKAEEVLFLFHGFNEKHWHKYLPWAHRLATATGKAVVLFPIAFHMNRAPLEWSDHRLMHRASEQRRRVFPATIASSLSNAAISTRLQARPQRFIWSGLQTYCDVLQLLSQIRENRHPLIAPEAIVDIFGYSIGCFLAQVLMMTNPGGLLEHARLGMFCGGAVFNRISPVSKFILDSESNVALYSYVVEHLESHLQRDARLRHYLGEAHPEGMNFRRMLNYGVMRKEREAQFTAMAPRLMAITLEQDSVIPPYEVINTLQGSHRDIPVRVDTMEFPYPCQHEDPFPAIEGLRGPVDQAFRNVFDAFAEFFA
jgi:hypothetical protein